MTEHCTRSWQEACDDIADQSDRRAEHCIVQSVVSNTQPLSGWCRDRGEERTAPRDVPDEPPSRSRATCGEGANGCSSLSQWIQLRPKMHDSFHDQAHSYCKQLGMHDYVRLVLERWPNWLFTVRL
jgi:hypothetical protein